MTSECRSIGVVAADKVNQFVVLLRGMCTSYRAVALHETVLKMPIQGGTATKELRLIRSQDPSKPGDDGSQRWIVRAEGAPMPGKGIITLPAAIRPVQEGVCWGSNTLDFWLSVGGKVDYEYIKRGHEYICMYQAYELKAQVYQLTPKKDSKDVNIPKLYVVDVTTVVPDSQAVEAAKAVGMFGQQLLPFVELRRAANAP